MKATQTSIPEVVLIQPRVFEDQRGFFMETFHERGFKELGLPEKFVQDNHSGSRQGILRGLHYQIRQIQGKLVRAVVGEIFDVAVDIRRSSPTFRQWVGLILTGENRHQLWIPPGFAHGFYVLSEWAEVIYKVTDYYAPEWEKTLLWDDPAIGIKWPLIDGKPPVLSDKDVRGEPLGAVELFD